MGPAKIAVASRQRYNRAYGETPCDNHASDHRIEIPTEQKDPMSNIARSPAVAVGDRIRLVKMHIDLSPVPAGSLGTVWSVGALGTVHVSWDGGGEHGLVPEVDRYERVAGD